MNLQERAPAMSAAPFLRRWLPWIVLAAALLWVALLADAHVGWWLNGPQPKLLRRAARLVSNIGDWPSLVGAAIVVGTVGVLLRRRWVRIVCLMVVAASVAGMAANVSRCLTGRTRPCAEISQGWYGPPVIGKHAVARHAVNSFPSAHTSVAMAFFITLMLLAPNVGVWFLPAPFLVGASRLLLGVHHFSDVWAGLLLGIVAALITCRAIAPYWGRFRAWWRTLPLPDLSSTSEASA